ncbi:unnamed protein product [Clavelina lepadiformis]|uniref:Thyroglobulin type-1 domain-containing protein n=1 Tax=Clavelina lepadiformis TaxID=159417 RepID=A0ABP0FNL8_CLALP
MMACNFLPSLVLICLSFYVGFISATMGPCAKQFDAIKRLQRDFPNEVFEYPDCNSDGTYAYLQCSQQLGVCRCYKKDGTIFYSLNVPITQKDQLAPKCHEHTGSCWEARKMADDQREIFGFDCDETDGTYKPRQCDHRHHDISCYCVSKDGKEIAETRRTGFEVEPPVCPPKRNNRPPFPDYPEYPWGPEGGRKGFPWDDEEDEE